MYSVRWVYIGKIDTAFAVAATAFFNKKRTVSHAAQVKERARKKYSYNDALNHDAKLINYPHFK